MVWVTVLGNINKEGDVHAGPQFTTEEYQKILSLVSPGSPTKLANLVGKRFAFFSSLSNSWIIDSGATDHMVSSLALLQENANVFFFQT